MAFIRFHALLQERVDQQIENIKLDLANGVVQSFEDYKYQAGIVHGLKMCLIFCEDIEREYDERSGSGTGG